jgi:hypothetical protein
MKKFINNYFFPSFVVVGVALAVFIFFQEKDKDAFIANGFGAFLGVGLTIGVDRWIEADRRERLRRSLLRACLALTNSNIGKINDVIKYYGSMGEGSGFFGAVPDLQSGIKYESYSSFLDTGLQMDLNEHFQNKFLYVKAIIVELQGYIAGRNAHQREFANEVAREEEWFKIVKRLEDAKKEFMELAGLIKKYLKAVGEKEIE